MIKLIGGSDGGQGSIREGDSTINPFPQMRYFSAPSSVGVRIFNRGLHLLRKIAKAPIFAKIYWKRFVRHLPFDVELLRVGEKVRNREMVQLSLSSNH